MARTILNISLPPETAKMVERETKEGGYASKSEYIRHVLRREQFFKEIEKSKKEIKEGKGKVLKSLKDLR